MAAHCSCLVIQLRSQNNRNRIRQRTSTKNLSVGCWNVRTLQDNDAAPERKTALVSLELQRYDVDIAVLCETRLPGNSQLREERGGYDFFWSGKAENEPRQSGVGFAIKSKLANSLSSLPKGISDRVATLSLELEGNTMVTLVSCYAPTLASSDQEKDDFYDTLRDVLSRVRHQDKLILAGDFNARVGSDRLSWTGVLGKHGIGKVNANGLRLLTICREFDLCITNTMFQQPVHRKTTWMHPRSKDWHLIDFVITKRKHMSDFKITRSFHTSCYLSDHALLRSKLSLHVRRHRVTRSTVPKRIDVRPLKSKEKKTELSNKLDENLEGVDVTDDVESSWKALREATQAAAVEVLGMPRRKHQDWFDESNDEVKALINQMHSSHKCWIEDKNSTVKHTAYKKCKGEVQRALRAMKERWWYNKAIELQEAADSKNTKAFYDGLKEVFGPQKSGASPLSTADGEALLTDKSDILNRWKEHFETVLNTSSVIDDDVMSSIPQNPDIPELSLEPAYLEVWESIKQIASGKSPSPKDPIPPEVYKHGGHALVKKLHALFVEIWKAGRVPQDYKDACIKHLYKNKGVRNVCDNHRGISLLSIAGKILARLILNRIIKHLVDKVCPESQCGFRSGRGTVDMIFSLRQVAEKVREKNQELYMVFVDLTKAFDTVNRDALWQVLRRLGIPENMLSVIISFHEGMKASVVSDGMMSDPFDVTNGTKQGCVMAPVLFALFFSLMLKHAFSDLDTGVKFQFRSSGGLFNHQRFKAKTLLRTEIIRDLLFADDAALVATSFEEARVLLDRFSAACKAFGLTISIRKTEVVHQPHPTPKQVQGLKQNPPEYRFPARKLKVDGHDINYVKCFPYLGSKVNQRGSLDDEIVNRIAKATSAFGNLRHRLWNERGIRLDTKILVYRAVVLSILLYGSESWTPYRHHINQLDVFHKSCLRSICGLSLRDKVSNAELFTKCKISGIESFLIRSQLRWAGHVLRMPDDRIPKIAMYSQLQGGKRNVGRPWLRYKDKLKSNLAAVNIPYRSLEDEVSDRKGWRSRCFEGIQKFQSESISHLKENRERAKRLAAAPISAALNPHSCSICGLVCKSLAGLKSHQRQKHK